MKAQLTVGFVGIILSGIQIFNGYVLPVIRHKELMDKVNTIDERLKKIEK
jgi:hypothetical protein